MNEDIWQALKALDLALEREQELWEGLRDSNATHAAVFETLNAIRNSLGEVLEHAD